MPATKVIKQSPVEASRRSAERTRPVKVKAVSGAQAELRVPSVRKSRASSCSRHDGGQGTTARRATLKTGCERRSRSSSNTPRINQDCKRASSATRSARNANLSQKCPKMSVCQREPRGGRGEAKYAIQSHKAFTVIPPNPKKRREIQRKAEAELAALEELRLSRAMAYVSINPSSVGGCMSLEEVRSKQQQEMMKAKRKQKPIKTPVMEERPVLEV